MVHLLADLGAASDLAAFVGTSKSAKTPALQIRNLGCLHGPLGEPAMMQRINRRSLPRLMRRRPGLRG